MRKLLIAYVIITYVVTVFGMLSLGQIFEIHSIPVSMLKDYIVEITAMGIGYIFLIINIISAVVSIRNKKCLPFQFIMICKLFIIPCYVVNSAYWFFSLILWILLGSSPDFTISLTPLIISTYFNLLGTSCHIICALFSKCKEGILSKKEFIFNVILQLIFLIDIFGCILLVEKYENPKKVSVKSTDKAG